uniref:Glucose-methanol-choline oxidoreductase N-terminal domain-containing protein n=1 Tax=Heliothis virescens TaxID=7102 RepID=A0A2A4J1P5_HELVI
MAVLVLEAGMEQPDVSLVPGLYSTMQGSNVDWGYTTMPDGRSCLERPGQACSWPRGKMMGGSTSINSYAYIRGNKLDYDKWAEMGNDGWSYKESEEYLSETYMQPTSRAPCGGKETSEDGRARSPPTTLSCNPSDNQERI